MNDYRKSQRRKGRKGRKDEYLDAYDGDSLEDYVKCICGAYTHWRQIKVMVFYLVYAYIFNVKLYPNIKKKMQLDVDGIIRKNHPMVCSDVRIILEASNY